MLLMPGMDGTGLLFRDFLHDLSASWSPHVITYRSDLALGYDALLQNIAIPDEPFAVIPESFSGPLAIRLLAAHKHRVRALVLVASFARAPMLAKWFGWSIGAPMFVVPPPSFLVRAGMLGLDADQDCVDQVRAAVASVRANVLAARVRAIASVDVRDMFAASDLPVLYLVGLRDRMLGLSSMHELSGLRANVECVVLDAPHLVLQAKPREAARVIEEFLSRVQSCA